MPRQPERLRQVLRYLRAGKADVPALSGSRFIKLPDHAPAYSALSMESVASETSAPNASRVDALLPGMIQQFRNAHIALQEAATTAWITRQTLFIHAWITFVIVTGIILTLPVVFLATEESILSKSLFIPLVSIQGTVIGAWVSFLVARWFYRREQTKRLQVPQQNLALCVDLFLRVWPEEVERWRGRDIFLRPENLEHICQGMEQVVRREPARAAWS